MKRKKPLRRSTKPIKRSGRIAPRKKDPATRRFAKHRTPALTEWIKQQGCCICAGRPVDPAHIVERSLGSDDIDNVIPLCHWKHHPEQEGRDAEFEAKYGVNLKELAKDYTAMWRNEFGEAA